MRNIWASDPESTVDEEEEEGDEEVDADEEEDDEMVLDMVRPCSISCHCLDKGVTWLNVYDRDKFGFTKQSCSTVIDRCCLSSPTE